LRVRAAYVEGAGELTPKVRTLGVGEGADFRAPLGIAVIGGVGTSTTLTLLVIPTVYEILADSRDWMAAKLGKKTPGNNREPVHVQQ
jgi:hypothetical protein